MLELVRELAQLTESKRELEAELRQIETRLEPLREQVVDGMLQQGVSKLTLDGWTVYLSHTTYAGIAEGADANAVIDVLRQIGLADVVTLGTQRLSALLRREPLETQPEELRAVVRTYERVTPNVKRG